MAVVTGYKTAVEQRTASSSRASAANLSEAYIPPLTIQQVLTAASAIRQVVDNEENGTTLQSPSPAINIQEEETSSAVELGETNLLQSGNKSAARYSRRVPSGRLVHPPPIATPIPASSDDSGFIDTSPLPNSENGNIPCRPSQERNSSSPNPDFYVGTSIASEKSSSLLHSPAPEQDHVPTSPLAFQKHNNFENPSPSDPDRNLSPFSRSFNPSQVIIFF